LHEHVFVSWRPPDPESYAYLLGLYLGDGCVVRHARTTRLVIMLDGAYPRIVDWAADAIRAAGIDRPVSVLAVKNSRAVAVQSYSGVWPDVFPQAGPGKKHQREIVLTDWQRAIVDAFPRQFLRGLIHSDGCRCVNRFKTRLPSGRVAEYEYPRYFFSNLSADIRALFCEYCERLGVRWTQSNHRNISVSHRRSVAILDEFIGPKT
jgi:hypothetical protein